MLSEFLVGFLKAVGVPKASLVGNSMGAAVALYTAVHHPTVVDRIVLADGGGYRSPSDPPPGPGNPHLRQIQNGVTRDETREMFRLMWHDKARVTDAMVDDQLTMRLKSAFTITKIQDAGEKGLGALTEAEVRGVAAPTLVVWGKYDELANPSGADRLERAIPGARKVLIDDCGHLPQLEKPAEFNRLVRDFLLQAPGARP